MTSPVTCSTVVCFLFVVPIRNANGNSPTSVQNYALQNSSTRDHLSKKNNINSANRFLKAFERSSNYSDPSTQNYMNSTYCFGKALQKSKDVEQIAGNSMSPSGNFHNHWLHSQQARQASIFRAYENISDLSTTLLREYEAVSETLVHRILDETESLDVAQLETNETAGLGSSPFDTIVKKYFHFKSKFYFEINNWYYHIVFNMRRYFKDKHKYSSLRRSRLDTYFILGWEQDTDIRFNTIGIRLRDRISADMKSLRIRFYYLLNRMMSEQRAVQEFRQVILFAMGKQEM